MDESNTWKPIEESLGDDYTVVCQRLPDRPGHVIARGDNVPYSFKVLHGGDEVHKEQIGFPNDYNLSVRIREHIDGMRETCVRGEYDKKQKG